MAMLDNVTINQLRAFVAVCDQGSFSAAARQLNRAQSAISHAIKALESAFVWSCSNGTPAKRRLQPRAVASCLMLVR